MDGTLDGIKRYPGALSCSSGTLIVNEIYSAIDGEGPWQGYPVVIVRLMGCNLRCSYCDSKFAYFEGERSLVADVVEKAGCFGIPKVLVTGGEPLAQGGTAALICALLEAGMEVSLETNGSYPLAGLPPETVKIVDVKTPGSGEGGSFLEENLSFLGGKDCLKFVVVSAEDYEWASRFVRERPQIGCEILFIPAFKELEPRELAEYVLRDKLLARFSIQLHKTLWGDARGV